jgi:hypothetical protein
MKPVDNINSFVDDINEQIDALAKQVAKDKRNYIAVFTEEQWAELQREGIIPVRATK